MRQFILIITSLITFLGWSSVASAATTLTAYDFVATFSPTSPYPNLAGRFSVSYDTVTDVYSLSSLTFRIGATVYDTSNSGLGRSGANIGLGGLVSGTNFVAPSTNDYLLFVRAAAGVLTGPATFGYSLPSENFVRLANTATISAVPVPEPASWTLMLVGFGGVGFAMRRRSITATRIRFS